MKNRFRHCSDEHEAVSLLCLLLSSEDDKCEKQALHDEYDTFVSIVGGYREMLFDCAEDELFGSDEEDDYGDLTEADEHELDNYLKGYNELDDEPQKLDLVSKPFDDDGWDFLDAVNDEDVPYFFDADDLDSYPPGMTKSDLIHVGEIEPDDNVEL